MTGEIRAAYLAAEGYETPLAEELERRGATLARWHGRLALSPDPPVPSAWALDAWTDPRTIEVASVKAAADALRAMQRNWASYQAAHHRRAALIGERLPHLSARPLIPPALPPASHLGGWTLLEPGLMLASPTKTSPFVNGECRLVEDHIGPPSRAYLKLWEACARIGAYPVAGEDCIDLGAAPGGWTWAIATLGANVEAIDKAPLDARVAALPGVSWQSGSAFAIDPRPADWMFSDIIAYPDRILAMAERWIDSRAARRIVCTVKFQGATDHEAADRFARIPGGKLMHLFHNKHELTFTWSDSAVDSASNSQEAV